MAELKALPRGIGTSRAGFPRPLQGQKFKNSNPCSGAICLVIVKLSRLLERGNVAQDKWDLVA